MKNIFVLSILLISAQLSGQNITEDKEGNGSILFPVGNVSFNTTDAQLKMGYVHGVPSGTAYLKRMDTTTTLKVRKSIDPLDSFVLSSRFIYGAFATAKNDDGLGSLFEEGKFTSNAGVNALIGFKFYTSGHIYPTYRSYNGTKTALKTNKTETDKLINEVNEMGTDILSIAQKKNDDLKKANSGDTSLFNQIITDSKAMVDAVSLAEMDRLNVKIRSVIETGRPGVQTSSGLVLDNIIKKLDLQATASTKLKLNRSKLTSLKTQEQNELRILNNTGIGRNYCTFYVKGSLERREFTRYQPQFHVPDSIYSDSSFTGLWVSGNLNYFMPRKHWAFGLSGGYQLTDNYASMKSIKVNVSNVVYQDSLRTDKTTKDVTAVKGEYYTYKQVPIMLDAVWMHPNEDKSMVIALGGYFRYNYVLPQAERTLHSDWSIGATVNLFKPEKGFFIGGLYLQCGSEVNPEKKPKFGEIISAGITTKINLVKFDYSRIFPDSE